MIQYITDFLPFFNFAALCGSALIFLFPVTHRKFIVSRYIILICVFVITGVFSGFFHFGFVLNSALAYVVTLFAVFLCAEIDWKEIIYHSFWIVIASKLFMVIYYFIGYMLDDYFSLPFVVQLIMIVCYIIIFNFIIAITVAKSLLLNHSYHLGPRQFSSAFLLTIIFEILNYFLVNTFMELMELHYSALMVMGQFYCVTVLYLQNALFSKSAIKQELEKINYLWQHQKNQYNLAKENINLINQKCHDLRHQVAAIRIMSNANDLTDYLKDIENSINIYDSIVRTGNEALDIILTEKSLFCQSHSITISCVADGARLNFMAPVDLYTIFGNAIDNAIESVMNSKEHENRLIDVMIFKKNDLLIINIINPLNRPLDLEGDLPKSTKSGNNGYHGFGLKSIRYTVDKYAGFMTIDTSGQSFTLSIVIPLTSPLECSL